MSILLDTNVFLWAAGVKGKLSDSAISLLADPAQVIFFSAVSAWEIAIKWSKGRLTLPTEPAKFINGVVSEAGMSPLIISIRDACAVADLPFHHKDPFDRLLVAQARSHGLSLMTADPMLELYDVDVIALNGEDE